MGIPTKVPIDLVNPTPAASTDLSGYLPLSGGALTGTFSLVMGSTTTSNRSISLKYYVPENLNTSIATVQGWMTANDNNRQLNLTANPSNGEYNSYAGIRLQTNSDGTHSETLYNNPSNSSNSTQIATTAYVQSNLSNYLSLSGGTMSGSIVVPRFALTTATNDNELVLIGNTTTSGTAYPCFALRGSSRSSEPGTVYIRAATASEGHEMKLWPNGSATWCSKELERVEDSSLSSSSGYIKYSSGLQLIWGVVNIAASSTGTAVTFIKAFSSEPRIFLNTAWASAYGYSYGVQAISRSSTGFTAVCGSGSADTSTTRWSSGNCVWLAIGNWK